mmetsp:Transcript_39845/g.106211  ORF Transcript_39845/g.106211 Transcript_39845/m.106211 type:complete len:202 (+) Transcript_39845:695-1300(+)
MKYSGWGAPYWPAPMSAGGAQGLPYSSTKLTGWPCSSTYCTPPWPPCMSMRLPCSSTYCTCWFMSTGLPCSSTYITGCCICCCCCCCKRPCCWAHNGMARCVPLPAPDARSAAATAPVPAAAAGAAPARPATAQAAAVEDEEAALTRHNSKTQRRPSSNRTTTRPADSTSTTSKRPRCPTQRSALAPTPMLAMPARPGAQL